MPRLRADRRPESGQPGVFDKRPALIVQPTGVADIRTAVDFARENRGLLLAVKCGGHSFSGQSTCDRGMQIDLSLFRDVRVDPVARRACVTGGCLLGQVDHETTAFGLATPLGTVSDTGVGGNFGIVTNFEFQLHPMPQPIFTGQIVYPIERAREGAPHLWRLRPRGA